VTIDTDVFIDLAGQVAALAERVEQATAAEAILARASAPVVPFPARTGPQHARPRRHRHGLRLIPGGDARTT
jgi:hypothetical protein